MHCQHLDAQRGISPTLYAYGEELQRWLSAQADNDTALRQASKALCREAKNGGIAAEQVLILLHERDLPHHRQHDNQSQDERDLRYIRAVRILLQCYFELDSHSF